MSYFRGKTFSKVSSMFNNEQGNKIIMKVMVDERGVTVSASGPTSQVDHTWTPREAVELMVLLSDRQIMEDIQEKVWEETMKHH